MAQKEGITNPFRLFLNNVSIAIGNQSTHHEGLVQAN